MPTTMGKGVAKVQKYGSGGDGRFNPSLPLCSPSRLQFSGRQYIGEGNFETTETNNLQVTSLFRLRRSPERNELKVCNTLVRTSGLQGA